MHACSGLQYFPTTSVEHNNKLKLMKMHNCKIFNVMSDFCPDSVVRLSLNSCIIVLKCPLVLLSL